MRFRRKAAFRGKVPREPTSWLRTNVAFGAGSNVKDLVAGATLVQPRNINFTGIDVRTTLRRLQFNHSLVFNFAGGTTAANDVFEVGMGVTMIGDTETPLPNPLLAASTDTDSDWLWLATYEAVAPAAAFISVPTVLSNLKNQATLIDIKAQRKLDNDQLIAFVCTVRSAELNQSGHVPGTITVNGRVNVSALMQRTMRR